jgi:hypothetical protein
MDNKIDPCDALRVNLIAAAVGLQQCTKTASNIVPIPGGDRVIAIGTPAQIAQLLGADVGISNMNVVDPWTDLTTVGCPTCGGDGQCDDCDGQGQVIVSRADLATANSSAIGCGGTGKLNEDMPCLGCDACPREAVAALTRCAAGRDGECGRAECPQLRDGEPRATGRHCPLDSEGGHHD